MNDVPLEILFSALLVLIIFGLVIGHVWQKWIASDERVPGWEFYLDNDQP